MVSGRPGRHRGNCDEMKTRTQAWHLSRDKSFSPRYRKMVRTRSSMSYGLLSHHSERFGVNVVPRVLRATAHTATNRGGTRLRALLQLRGQVAQALHELHGVWVREFLND